MWAGGEGREMMVRTWGWMILLVILGTIYVRRVLKEA